MSVSSKPNLPPAISWDVFDPSQSKTSSGSVWCLNVEEYHQIISAGIFLGDEVTLAIASQTVGRVAVEDLFP
ncbi:MAG: hypothetical protein SXA11_08000 [Cyanobacteriota bacterium]|nr:hypothetical protein [Cyanobacteriota bacterium]